MASPARQTPAGQTYGKLLVMKIGDKYLKCDDEKIMHIPVRKIYAFLGRPKSFADKVLNRVESLSLEGVEKHSTQGDTGSKKRKR